MESAENLSFLLVVSLDIVTTGITMTGRYVFGVLASTAVSTLRMKRAQWMLFMKYEAPSAEIHTATNWTDTGFKLGTT